MVMKKRYLIALIISTVVLTLTYKFWLISKAPTSINFDFYIFVIIAIISYLGGLKLTDYLADFKDIRHQSRIEIIFLTVFFILLFIPMSHISNKKFDMREWRNYEVYKPFINDNLEINYKYGSDFEKWYGDRFNYRDKFLYLHDLKYLINRKIISNTVIEGEDNWLFYNIPSSNRSYQNTKLTTTELSNISEYIFQIDTYCKKHGKKFYFIVAPDKFKIYGEYYNKSIIKNKPDSEGMTYQLKEYLKNNYNINLIYPIDELLNHKNNDYVYYKDDTHWTRLGAYYGYRTLMTSINKDFPEVKIYVPKKYQFIKYKGDLNRALSDFIKVAPEQYRYKEPILKGISKCEILDNGECSNPKGAKYKVILYRDSFGRTIIPYMTYSFSYIKYLKKFDINKSDIENSNIVILEIVERSLPKLAEQHMGD